MEDRKIRIAITHGDTNGIGYEMIFKTFAAPEMLELCTPIIYGSPKVAAYHRNVLDLQANFSIINSAEEACDGRLNLLTVLDDDMKVDIGRPTEESGNAAVKALDRAIDDCQSGLVDAIVGAPVGDDNFKTGGMTYDGQTDFLEKKLGSDAKALRMIVGKRLRVAFVTTEIPLKDVPGAITQELVEEKAAALHETLHRDFRINNPRIAVLAMNPTTGNGYEEDMEETTILKPAIEKLEKSGCPAFGPYAAEEFFGEAQYMAFDAILAMYKDQGIVPFRTIEHENGLKIAAAMPVVMTMPDMGAEFRKAGKNEIDEQTMRNAIYSAIDIVRNRADYDDARKDPLKKLYHERRDESEKVRFNIPKKQVREE
ncbi:MAG: 4-hydroxythreonine-4-phosphate dehydrogenase PdxA [Prevotella sp.]|uniref:PdxA family dehydrogenase n=1 Tax=Prevotella sp. TaxID=59823 RepID=UPI002A3573E3|nr:4-hydroxythreonine-4-phosphate dehydrogenase PdxA [Prevotella sp.]MDD7317637.1 4-hydroxythreonine-4-phosphate dehydrogenase PdxA [Prevotellaceae bacterium]MDY4020516.1 4-hydroxythreonine-4-phosphate dehydrogenase PdxA [Prevotella sp.]